jgi:hypothetical protein
LVKSLVALQKGRCSVERDNQGCHLRCWSSARTSGEATAYFLASGASETSLEPLAAEQVSRARFESGQGSLKLFLSDNLERSLEKSTEDSSLHQIVLDLRADSGGNNAVTVQRSILKIGDGDAVQVVKQFVQCGPHVRCLEALFGTLPNPTSLSSSSEVGAGDAEGGDCVICLSKPREVVILHCRHVCLCSSCAKITSSTWSHQCPVCRGRVAAMVSIGSEGGDKKIRKAEEGGEDK